MPKRPTTTDELGSGWRPLLSYTPTVYKKEIRLKGDWRIKVYQVRKAMELYNPVLCYDGVAIEPCPARLELGISGEWQGKEAAVQVIEELRKYVRYE